jgi:hypothetical protein
MARKTSDMKIIENIIDETKSLVLAAALLLGLASSSLAQSLTVTTPAFVLTGGSGGALTNLGLGWSSSVITTNITYSWNTSGQLSSTNYTTNTTTSYADFSAFKNRYVVLQPEWSTDIGGGVSNMYLVVARSVNKLHFDTQNNIANTNASLGTGTNAVAGWQIDMGGYPYGRIVGYGFIDTSSSHHLTNNGVFVSDTIQGAAASGR